MIKWRLFLAKRVIMNNALFESDIQSLNLINRGKVRDIYAIDSEKMLIITTDRLSAFDVILPDPIPLKGSVLTAISNFWFDKLSDITPNHLTGIAPEDVVMPNEIPQVKNRAVVVQRLKPLPLEAVVRGYLIGSGYKDYMATGAVCGIELPRGLVLASKLPQTIFTPATKAEVGAHDENVSFEIIIQNIDKAYGDFLKTHGTNAEEIAHSVRAKAVELYEVAALHAEDRGIIIADTKFEFGLDENAKLILMDEALTPDSSRFWPADMWVEGQNPPSFDKQSVRDYLETLDWNKKAPGPKLPDSIIQMTSENYVMAFERLTALSKDDLF